jgi:hypothetical protein
MKTETPAGEIAEASIVLAHGIATKLLIIADGTSRHCDKAHTVSMRISDVRTVIALIFAGSLATPEVVPAIRLI